MMIRSEPPCVCSGFALADAVDDKKENAPWQIYEKSPHDEAKRNLKLFAKSVLPEVKKGQTELLKDPAERDARQHVVADASGW